MRYGLVINGVEVVLESDSEISVLVDYDHPDAAFNLNDSVALVHQDDLSPGWSKRLPKWRDDGSLQMPFDPSKDTPQFCVGLTEAKEQTP
jgi:hypothetical protein